MQMPADYHMHTPLCRHATGEPVDYARHAVKLGLTEIVFSDHSPMPREDFDDWRLLAGYTANNYPTETSRNLIAYDNSDQRGREAFGRARCGKIARRGR